VLKHQMLSIAGILLAILHFKHAAAQSRNDVRSGVAVSNICTLQRSVALLPETPEATPDARYPLAVVATATGALVAFRTATDTVYVARVDDTLSRVARDRAVSGPVVAFALATAPGGAVMLSAERDAQDGRDAREVLLLARLDTAANARNIPRALARVLRCDGVAITATATGFLAAWGAMSGPSTSTLTLDARGVPNATARIVVDGSAPSLVALTGATRFALSSVSATGHRLSHLDETGAAVEGWPLVARPRALVALSNVSLVFEANGESLSIARWWPGSALVEFTANSLRSVLNDTQVVQAISDRNSALVLVDHGNASEQFVRVQSDGTSTLLASRTGTHGAVAQALDGGSFFSAAHTIGHAGIELQRWQCPRTIVGPTPPSSPNASVPNDAGLPPTGPNTGISPPVVAPLTTTVTPGP
jgi:hypothetical protein